MILTFYHIVSKGISGHLLKANAKKRRSKAQIKAERVEEERKQSEIAKKLADYELLKKKEKEMDSLHEEKEGYRQMLSQIYEEGLIKQEANGTFVPVEDAAERESIKSKTKMKRM